MISTLDKAKLKERYDICIVGSGPSGMTLAAELASSGLKIAMIESGSFKRSSLAEELKEVQSEKLPIKANPRERVVGGASSTWGGLSALLDPADLAHWPLSFDELLPYLKAAAKYHFPSLETFQNPSGTGWKFKNLADKLFVAVRPPFNFTSLVNIFNRKGVDLYTEATVAKLVSQNGRIKKVLCRSVDGQGFEVSAEIFILACGGIENSRLLLVSGLGNEYDQVGRYFMNHPKGYAGRLHLSKPLPVNNYYLPRVVGGRMVYAGLRLEEELQKEKGLLNACVQFEPDLGIFQKYAFAIWRRMPGFSTKVLTIFLPRTLRARWFADMEPRAENRVILSDKLDRFGSPLPKVVYDLSERDKATLEELFSQLRSGVERLELGKLTGTAADVLKVVKDDASHHLGGTRMGLSPQESVVNTECRVHSSENLYVVGGSVFPSAGCASPTMTMVALSIRLAEHVKSKLASKPRRTFKNQTSRTSSQKILIIGAGNRVRGDVLPVLESLPGFEITGIFARHASSLFGAHRSYDVRTMESLSVENLKGARFLYVSVPRETLAQVLSDLPGASSLEVIIDTPVLPAVKKYAHKFKRIHVAEDSVFLPWLDGLKGREVKEIECSQSVFRYHGMALVKAFGPINYGYRLGNKLYLKAGNTKVKIIEPRDYASGKLKIDCQEPDLTAIIAELIPEERGLLGEIKSTDTIVSKMGELKRVGLRRLLLAASRGEETWSLEEGLNDVRIDWLLHKVWIYLSI